MRRRTWRETWADEGLLRRDFSFSGTQSISQTPGLLSYLEMANLTFRKLDDGAHFRARLALFPRVTFVHLVSPRASVHWPRDAQSRERMAVAICLAGGLRMNLERTNSPSSRGGDILLRRSERMTAHIVAPGVDPIDIELTEKRNEVVYLSMPGSIATTLRLSEVANEEARANKDTSRGIDEELLAPFMMFVARMCSIRARDTSPDSALAASSEEVARALTRVLLGEPPTQSSLFSRCLDTMLADYRDRAFTVEVAARLLGVSVRTVQVAFQRQGTSFAAELRGIRGRAALTMRAEENPPRKVLAERNGFGSIAALDRALASLT